MSQENTNQSNQATPFVKQLYEKVSGLVHRGENPPEGFRNLDKLGPEYAGILSRLNAFFTLKIHQQDGFARLSTNECFFTSTPEQKAALWLSPEFKEGLKRFFLSHRIFSEGRDYPKIYSELFLYMDKFLKAPQDRDKCSLYREENGVSAPIYRIDLSKPTILYCGGLIGLSEEDGYLYRAMRRCHRILDAGIDESSYAINALTYRNSMTISKVGYILAYQSDPENFYSPQAQDFVLRFLKPYFCDTNGVAKDFDTTIRAFENLRFVSYSYGTCFVGEMRNCLKQELLKAGHSAENTSKILSSIAGLCVGSLTPVIDKAGGDFVQLHIIDRGDKMSHSRRDFTKYDWQKTAPDVPISYYRCGNHLALYTENTATTMPQVRLEPPRELTASIQDVIRDGGRDITSNPEYRVINASRPNIGGHAIEAYLLTTRYRLDDGAEVVQANPAAHIGRSFINDLIHAASKTNQDPTKLLDKIIAEALAPERIQKSEVFRSFMLGLVGEIASSGTKSR